MPAPVAINPSNLWRLANTNFLNSLAADTARRCPFRYQFTVNDKVRVVAGKDMGKIGRVRRIIPEIDQVIVEGVHTRIQSVESEGTRVQLLIDRAVPTECVQLVHPVTFQPVQVEWMLVDSGFGYKRFTRFILPEKVEEMPVVLERGLHAIGPKDTAVEDAFKVTYVPDVNKNPLPYGCLI